MFLIAFLLFVLICFEEASHLFEKQFEEVKNEDGTTSYVAHPTEEESEKLTVVEEELKARPFADVAKEYSEDGKLTGNRLEIPAVYKAGMGNYGFEALAYDEERHVFWTMNESTLKGDGAKATSQNGVKNILRLQSFGDDLRPLEQFAYAMDAPTAHSKADEYAMGVSEIAALGDGRLLVLEREFFVPRAKLGAFVTCKLYEIAPNEGFAIAPYTPVDKMFFLPKRLVHSFTTKLNVFDRSLANYEGMCLGPTLKDGSKVLVLVSDSQNRFRGVLKDWFKTIVLQD